MPIHLDDLDVGSELAGSGTALIVPCNMCPAVTAAVKEDRPFLELFRRFLRSDPFERRIKALQSRLKKEGVDTEVFRSDLPHQWFLCMWTSARRKKLRDRAKKYDAVIVLGCDTANETVRDSVECTGCSVVEGMKVVGFMNARLRIGFPGNVSFEGCKIIPMPQLASHGDRLKRRRQENA